MGEGDVGAALHATMIVVLKMGGPALLSALAVGVFMSLVQAITQVNEATLAFVPKVVVIVGVLALTGPFMLATLSDYTHGLFDQMIAIGGQ
ncbi:flagellar biosynthetic protein FliQ [Acidisphaera sp. L21]|uniref:flagellar biosynthetic protein FliQ n=1 Tax=Acidisphaera sp. L21 TaxID=1641851 RepID=UPI00131D64D7|nr:flagellar biosynthetic protein FliQ [Acidisphaera sp. L21]